ncbi:MAG: iron-sulfur cluster biosynthesis protein [Paenibacillus sp.]|nr:iron-sulfur cluster biosynthesis protein [Paenibacillus sp.]
MKIICTVDAAEQLRRRFPHNGPYKLAYDAEGCGCAVNGVPALWLVDEVGPEDVLAEADADELPFIYEKRHELFFEDRLKIDYNREKRTFRLASDGQIYTPDLKVVDKRAFNRIGEVVSDE